MAMGVSLKEGIFSGLTQHQLQKLLAAAKILECKKGITLINEGIVEKTFYYLLDGSVSVFRHKGRQNHSLTVLEKGESIGELALLDDAPRSTSVVCLEDCKFYQFDIDKLKKIPDGEPILKIIIGNIAQQLSKRLRYTNDVTLEALRHKFAMSVFSIRMLILLAFYTLSLNFLEIAKHYFSSTTLISLVLIVIFALVLFSIIRQSGYRLGAYGLNSHNAFRQIIEAVVFSLPVIGIILFVKWLVITQVPGLQHFPLFDNTATFKDLQLFSWKTYFLSLLGYAVFCPVQEFIVRGCVQSSLQNLLDGTATMVKWRAIIISNVLFASTHAHTSLGFSLMAFIPGVFWGWLYHRHRSLIGVSLSHILIGVWAAFIVGFENIL